VIPDKERTMPTSQTAGKLENRGIAVIAKANGWKPERKKQNDNGVAKWEEGWAYPICHYQTGKVIAKRWKAANKATSQSPYAWLPSKPKDPAADWYILPGTPQAIAAQQGTVYLANGEPALLAYHAAGIHNVIATTLSEISVPKNTLDVLRALGVSRLLYPIDNDEAGLQSAINWRDALRGSGIDFQAFSWGESATAKADANDMWIAVGFDTQAFARILANLSEMLLPAPEAKKEPAKIAYSGKGKEALVAAVIAGYESIGYRGHGKYLNGRCLFHDDESASGGVNRETGWTHCFVCGNLPPEKSAAALGITIDDFFPSVSRPAQAKRNSPLGEKSMDKSLSDIHQKADSSAGKSLSDIDVKTDLPSDEKSPLWFLGTLPDSWRSAFCRYFKPSVAPVVELVHELARQGYIQPEDFTLEQIFDQEKMVGFFLPAKTIREMITEELESFFPKNDIKNDIDSMPKKGKKLGRPAQTYRFASFEVVKATILAFANPRIKEQHFPGTDPELLVTVFEAPMLEAIEELSPAEANEITALLNSKTKDFRAKNEVQYKVRWKRAKRQYFALEASLSNLHSTELPPAPIRKAKDYKALFLRGQVEAGQDNRSGREIAQSLGMQRQSVNQVLSYAGVKNTEQFDRVTIDKSNVAKLDRIGYEVKGYPRKLQIENEEPIPYRQEEAVSVINAAIEQGKQVTVTYQLKSKQVIATDEIFPAKPANKPEKRPTESVEKVVEEHPVDAQKRKEQRHYGTSFDPAWVKRQLVLALMVAKLGYIQRGASLLDTRTGETWDIDALSSGDIICLFRGQNLERNIA
jgi:hypothetical protein